MCVCVRVCVCWCACVRVRMCTVVLLGLASLASPRRQQGQWGGTHSLHPDGYRDVTLVGGVHKHYFDVSREYYKCVDGIQKSVSQTCYHCIAVVIAHTSPMTLYILLRDKNGFLVISDGQGVTSNGWINEDAFVHCTPARQRRSASGVADMVVEVADMVS
jgi:hypothetical protein